MSATPPPGTALLDPALPAVDGECETHITLAPPPDGAERLAAWAAAHGAGFTHIELARGRHPSQPMATLRGRGTADERQRRAAAFAAELTAAGFRPVRIKTEAAPWARGVPATDAEAAAHGLGRYFEHHVKLVLGAGEEAGLAARAVPHGAHVSRNARRIRGDGREERFVTQRCHGVGRHEAGRRLAALLTALHGLRILEVEREFVTHDTALDLDDGWITGDVS